MHDRSNRQKNTINHLSRIQGQMNVLKQYIHEDRSCQEIAQLTASITASFNALRTRTLSGYIQHELLQDKLPTEKEVELESILKLYKK